MRGLLLVLAGVVAGACVAAAAGFTLLRPLFMATVDRSLGDVQLRPGAAAWEAGAGGLVDAEVALPPDASISSRRWVSRGEGRGVAAASYDPSCRITREPGRHTLPSPPSCSGVEALVGLDDGSLVALGVDAQGAAAAWQSATDGAPFVAIAAPPVPATGSFTAGPQASAVLGGADDRVARLERGAWTLLPAIGDGRRGYGLLVAGDGTITAVGGERLETPRRAGAFSLLPLLIAGLVITAAALARRRHVPLRGAAIAFVVTLVLGAVGFVTMLGGLGWR